MVTGYLFDTNILLRLSRSGDLGRTLIECAIHSLLQQSATLFYCPQNIVESIGEAECEVRLIERADPFRLAPFGKRLRCSGTTGLRYAPRRRDARPRTLQFGYL